MYRSTARWAVTETAQCTDAKTENKTKTKPTQIKQTKYRSTINLDT